MVVASTSSSSSCHSYGSFDEAPVNICGTVKFLCSHSGRILPRYPDGRLRYVGGETRVLSVDRSLRFSGIKSKMKELCGWESVNLRCQLPTEDLDTLISITSDEDLSNLIAEHELARRDQRFPIKIRAFLHQTTEKAAKSLDVPQIPKSRMVLRAKTSVRHPVVHPADSQFIHQPTSPAKPSVHLAGSGYGSPFRGCLASGCHAAARHGLPHNGNTGNSRSLRKGKNTCFLMR